MVFISTPITRGVLFCWCSGPFGGSLTVLPVSLSVWMEAVMMHPRVELKVLLKVCVMRYYCTVERTARTVTRIDRTREGWQSYSMGDIRNNFPVMRHQSGISGKLQQEVKSFCTRRCNKAQSLREPCCRHIR